MSGRKRDRTLASPSPAIAAFFRGYLHQDGGLEHQTWEAAFDQYWDDASAEERLRFGLEWRALRRRLSGRVWRRVESALTILGASWLPRDGKSFAQLRRHIDERTTVEPSAVGGEP